MCIRDSGGAVEDELHAEVLGGLFGAGDARHVVGVALGLGPVSYTHLRAHETVLDLVCRLLLEKKKKKHTIDGALLYWKYR